MPAGVSTKKNGVATPPSEAATQPDPVESAKSAGLRYVNDSDAGILRTRRGKGFSYSAPDGTRLSDERMLDRIAALAIPPAWTNVWICTSPRGHLQATGRDEKGRKQYRYHQRWRETRDEAKYDRMIAFGEALPTIRERTDDDISRRGLPREKVLAVVVRLLEGTLIRIGNEEYARENRSYGLTTLRNKHVEIDGSEITFEFNGKSGKQHAVGIRDRRLARVVAQIRDLPGQELFQYVDEDGTRHSIGSEDVNAYLRGITGENFTAKDFRTRAGTVLAAHALDEIGAFDSDAQAKKNVIAAVESVAKKLGNTPAICRKCYVHPAVIDAYLDGSMTETLKTRAEELLCASLSELPPEEAAVLAFLQQRLARDAEQVRA
ncbi:MAG: DNA topoisomerase IB [Chloroflexota bacterium]|nr:DNA topoisomerase IB [Chloroflexota bacterium]